MGKVQEAGTSEAGFTSVAGNFGGCGVMEMFFGEGGGGTGGRG